jgi:hypothetical protein
MSALLPDIAELGEFCDCILERRQPRMGSLEFARQVMQVYEAAQVSEGKRVEI